MRYRFKDKESGQIAEGYTVLQIVNFECEVANDDTEAILLAEKSGGELVVEKAPAKVLKETTDGGTK